MGRRCIVRRSFWARWGASWQTPQADADRHRTTGLGTGDGSTIPVFETEIGRIGAAICWENYMPDLRQSMYARGINLWCAPTVDERDIWQASMRHIAYEGRTFVLSACQYMTRADAPENYTCHQGNNPETVLIRGGSVIVNPLGEIIAGPIYDREAIITVDIDLDDVIREI